MKRINIPRKYFEKALEQGKTLTQMSKELNICVDTVKARALEYKIKIPRKSGNFTKRKTFTYINKQWLIDNWINTNNSIMYLANQEGCGRSLLETRVKEYHLTKRYKYKVNLEKLKDVRDPILNYFAGLLATDGHMERVVNAHYIDITLVGSDEEILLTKLNDYFENERPISCYDNVFSLTISNENIMNTFIDYFDIPEGAKTFKVGTPRSFYNEDCARMYVRGCFDGDGSISRDGNSLSFYTGSLSLVTGLIDIIRMYTGVRKNLLFTKGDTPDKKYLGFEAGGSICFKILDWVYLNNLEFKLERKYKRYIKNRFM